MNNNKSLSWFTLINYLCIRLCVFSLLMIVHRESSLNAYLEMTTETHIYYILLEFNYRTNISLLNYNSRISAISIMYTLPRPSKQESSVLNMTIRCQFIASQIFSQYGCVYTWNNAMQWSTTAGTWNSDDVIGIYSQNILILCIQKEMIWKKWLLFKIQICNMYYYYKIIKSMSNEKKK